MPLDLICPAQGSPVPAHRFVHPSRSSLAEPVGGSAPKFSTDLTTSGVKRSSNAPFSLSCPAQGSPVPAYRFYLILVFSEPVGGSSPKFATDVTRSDVQRSSFVSFSLSCPAQGSPVPAFRFLFSKLCIFFSEPVGGSAPKFPSANTISGFSANLANTFNLPCPAQGSPIPSFRFVKLLYSQPFEWGKRLKFSLQHLLFATQEPPASLSLKFYS